MTKIRLNTYKANAENGFHTIIFDFDPPFPPRDLEVKNTAEAEAAVAAFAKEVEPTGVKTYISASLHRGERSPNGFKASKKTDAFVNC